MYDLVSVSEGFINVLKLEHFDPKTLTRADGCQRVRLAIELLNIRPLTDENRDSRDTNLKQRIYVASSVNFYGKFLHPRDQQAIVPSMQHSVVFKLKCSLIFLLAQA
tara:strand:- start:608 stop:928 length:321 start_codon:yes stop_codon:yes gene_type:complete